VARWDEEVDLVCVGSGIGGCASAVAGAEAGLSVLLLEKSNRVGGTTAWSLGIVWAGNTGRSHADSADETLAYLNYLGGGRNNPEVTARFVAESPEALRFFERAGVPFYLVEGLPDHYYPAGSGSKPGGRSFQTRPFKAQSLGDWQERLEFTPFGHGRITFEEMAAWGGRPGYRNWDRTILAEREAEDVRTFGAGLAGHFFKSVLDRGVPVELETPAQALLVEDHRVVGVELRSDGETRSIRARKGVVLATGQYSANRRLMGWFDEFNSWPPGGAPRNQGDGSIMALEHGAAFSVQHWNLTLMLGFHVPGEEADGQPLTHGAGSRELTYPHSILVNRRGRRFADESVFGDVAAKLRHFDAETHGLVNLPCYFVFDSQYFTKFGLPPLMPGADPPNWLLAGETISELAQRLDIDAAGLGATVDRFNDFCESGEDKDFQRGSVPWSRNVAGDLSRKNPNLGPIVQPPFFGLELLPVNGNAVGLVTNANGQVIHLRGEPIPGLYACGEVAAGLHYGVGYQAGLSLGGAMTFGWLAAKHAAAR